PASRVKVPANAQRLDCAGLTITAGFWNSHVHFTERKWADAGVIPAAELSRQLTEMLTRYGFTSVFDLGSQWENTRKIRDRIEAGEVTGPRIRSVGQGLVPPGSLPNDTVVAMMGWMKPAVFEPADAAQATAAAIKLLDSGVDGIKLFASGQRGVAMPQETMSAAVEEAHRRGKPVFVHPNSAADVWTAVRAGVDVIGHTTPASGPWDTMLVAAMKERAVALTPTLTIWKWYARHDRVSAQDKTVETVTQQLRAWVATGGTVLFGSDLGAIEYDPSEEYALMSQAGMTFAQILASLTTAPAARFGGVGKIAVGADADVVAFKDGPANVRYTIRGGRVVFQ
ncbi:MAG TPA: amidohydrolase family protein, partial [Candidatus Solibacter sp.]|nr:amidohydrolase family protein [Candidatus Solibacter sp.]